MKPNFASQNKIISLIVASAVAIVALVYAVLLQQGGLEAPKAKGATSCPPDNPPNVVWIDTGGDFCILKDDALSVGVRTSWPSSSAVCNLFGTESRHCTAAEWVAACELDKAGIISLDDMTDNPEWIGDLTYINYGATGVHNHEGLFGGDSSDCGTFGTSTRTGDGTVDHKRCCVNKE